MVSVKQSSARVRCAPHPDSQATLTALSFFPGAMGLDIGLAQAGFETCLASEIDRQTIATIRQNRPEIPLIGDIRNYSAKDVLEISGFSDGEKIDVMVGGPPVKPLAPPESGRGFMMIGEMCFCITLI